MKQSTLRTALAAGIALLMPVAGYSQAQLGGTTADKKMQGNSSTGSAMGGLYTPSLYDGTANINIPIYQYSTDGGNYGVSLSYNTRGVKVSELAGQIGLHWNLVAGGSIQRVVKDIPDDVYEQMDDSIEVDMVTIANPDRKVRGRLVVYGENATEMAETGVYRDAESDDYIVSVGNLSFTFNLGKNGFVFTNPQRNVKVELIYGGAAVLSLPSIEPLATPTFCITDEQGTRYFFEKGDFTSEEIKDKFGHQQNIGAYTYATSWVVSKIITASGAEINYAYTHTGHSPSYMAYNAVEPSSNDPGGADPSDIGQYVQISYISYPNGTAAVFQYDNVSSKDAYTKALREIQLMSNGEIQLRYKLNQSYLVGSDAITNGTNPEIGTTEPELPYNTPYSSANKSIFRLKLNSISIQGKTGAEELFYSFNYSPVRLPKRFNGSQDYFGYYNAKVPTTPWKYPPDAQCSIPLHQYFSGSGSYGVDRTPDINYLKACILTKISNAFGGQIEFLYDAHQLNPVLSSSYISSFPEYDAYFMGQTAYDGLRLQAIIEKDIFHTENYRKTIFTYNDGQIFMNGGYFHYLNQLYDNNHNPKTILFTNQYVSRHQLVNGANHGYSSVEAKTVDENNNQLSRTVYNFSNFKDGSNAPKYLRVGTGSKHFFEFPFAEKQFLRDWEMGLLLSTKEYDQNDRITLETNNTYAFSIDSTTTAGKIENTRTAKVKTDLIVCCYDALPNTVDYTDTYRPFRGKAQLINSQTKKYISDNSYIDDAVTYKYDSHNNITHTLAKNSKGEYFKTENVYNYDLAALPGSGLQAFTDAGLEKVVSNQRWKTDATGTTYTRLMDGFINTFDYTGQNVRPKAMYTFVPGDAVTATMYAGGTGLSNSHGKILQAFNGTVPDYFRKTSEVMLSDAKGNPLESRIGDQDIFKAMIWNEATGQKLAEAGSCHYADIAYCGFETPGSGMVTKGNITYNAANINAAPFAGLIGKSALKLSAAAGSNSLEGSQTLIAGKEYVLSFGVNGALPQVYSGSTLLPLSSTPGQSYYNFQYYTVRFTASAGDKFKIVYNGGTSNTFIDDVRLHPVTAQMQSWSYTPMFGADLIMGGNGQMTFIEYDGQGRPKVVRDKDGNIISKTEYGIQ